MLTETAPSATSEEGEAFTIACEADVARAVRCCRLVSTRIGFNRTRAALIATALSELAHNALYHAGGGMIGIRKLCDQRTGIEIEAVDEGPGIADVDQALQEHFSTRGTLGVGLPAVRRIMDELDIETDPGRGTRVIARKWL